MRVGRAIWIGAAATGGVLMVGLLACGEILSLEDPARSPDAAVEGGGGSRGDGAIVTVPDGGPSSDGGAGDGATLARCDTSAPWAVPALIVPAFGVRDDFATLSADELTIVFGHLETSGGSFALWSATRVSRDQSFTTPNPYQPGFFGSASHPSFAEGDEALYFAASPQGSRNIVRATRQDGGVFGAKTIVFDGSTRIAPQALRGELWFREDAGLSSAPLLDGGLGAPRPYPELDVAGSVNLGAALSSDGRELYFGRGAADGGRGFQVWRAIRSAASEGFESPTLVTELRFSDPEVDTYPSWLSADGCRLYLLSDRAGLDRVRLYQTTRRPP